MLITNPESIIQVVFIELPTLTVPFKAVVDLLAVPIVIAIAPVAWVPKFIAPNPDPVVVLAPFAIFKAPVVCAEAILTVPVFKELPPIVRFPLVRFEPIVILVIADDDSIEVDFNDVIVSAPCAVG